MHLRFLGHAAFDLTLGGVRVCLDPHRPGAVGGRLQLPAIVGPFDAIVCTHQHEDHAGWTPELETTRFLDHDTTLGGLELRTRAVFHDQSGGTRMGLARMVSLTDGQTRVVHCGDLGTFDAEDVAWLQGSDILLVPAGGTFTLDGEQAADLARRVDARWTVPMHARDPRVDLPLQSLEVFLAAWRGPVERREVLTIADPPPPGVVLLAPP